MFMRNISRLDVEHCTFGDGTFHILMWNISCFLDMEHSTQGVAPG